MDIKNLNSTLIEASTEGNGPMIQETSAKLGINSKNMDQCLIDLEEEMLSLEEGEIEFAILVGIKTSNLALIFCADIA